MNRFLCFLSSTMLASAALAGNIVNNPGFETGFSTGWEEGDFRVTDAFNGHQAHTGSFFAETGCVGATCITDPANALTQTHLAQTDDIYTLSFFYDLGFTGDGGPNPNTLADFAELRVVWGPIQVLDVTATNLPDAGYVFFSVDVPGDSDGGEALQFFGRNDPDRLLIDDVCVVLKGGTCDTASTVPEPTTALLLGVGLLAVGLARRRSHRN